MVLRHRWVSSSKSTEVRERVNGRQGGQCWVSRRWWRRAHLDRRGPNQVMRPGHLGPEVSLSPSSDRVADVVVGLERVFAADAAPRRPAVLLPLDVAVDGAACATPGTHSKLASSHKITEAVTSICGCPGRAVVRPLYRHTSLKTRVEMWIKRGVLRGVLVSEGSGGAHRSGRR